MRAVKTAAVGTLLVSVAGVAAASAATADNGRGGEVIHATRVTEDRTVLDLGPSGASLGDQIVFTARFEANGEAIGYDGGVCTLVRRPQVHQCVATNQLPGGQLTTQALVDFARGSGPFSFAITGGTGRYRTAHGTVNVVFGASTDQVTFRIITRSGRHA